MEKDSKLVFIKTSAYLQDSALYLRLSVAEFWNSLKEIIKLLGIISTSTLIFILDLRNKKSFLISLSILVLSFGLCIFLEPIFIFLPIIYSVVFCAFGVFCYHGMSEFFVNNNKKILLYSSALFLLSIITLSVKLI